MYERSKRLAEEMRTEEEQAISNITDELSGVGNETVNGANNGTVVEIDLHLVGEMLNGDTVDQEWLGDNADCASVTTAGTSGMYFVLAHIYCQFTSLYCLSFCVF